VIFPDARLMAEGHEDRERSDAYRRQELDDKISVDIRQICVIRVLFQLRIENHNYLSHFEKRYSLDQSNYLTDDQCNLMDAAKPVAAGDCADAGGVLRGVREQDGVR
jgi:hypothetical protein